MKDLFSPEGWQALRAFIARPLLCLFDFDGTLAPLVADPDAVLLSAAVRARLQALQQRAPIGIVTGRALADLRPRLAFVPDYLIGNHGLEGVPGASAAKAEAALLARVACWKAELEPGLAVLDPGIRIEDKHYSLSLHYLQARDPEQAARALRERIAALSPPPRVIPGKSLLNVLPSDVGDKGSAVQALLAAAGLAQALYVGDDLTDEDVFRLPQPGLFTVHVGRDEGSAAQWRLHEQRDVETLLDWLVTEVPAGRRGLATAPARPGAAQTKQAADPAADQAASQGGQQ